MPTTEVYVLPDGEVIARAQNMFLFPLPSSRLRFLSDKEAYVVAYRITYSELHGDPLSGMSVRSELQKESDRVLNACIVGVGGEKNGLAQFFNDGSKDEFKGFTLNKGIATDMDHQRTFFKSVREAFDTYYLVKKAQPQTCREALRGMGLVVSAAAMINGIWIPEVQPYLNN